MWLHLLRLWAGPLPQEELFPLRKVNPFLHWFFHPIKRRLAKYYLFLLQRFFGLKVIALTGSCGKTTTTNLLYSVLSLAGSTVKTADSVTTTYNLPTTILTCTPKTRYLILEMGVEFKGDMDFYCWQAKPDISTVLNISSVHSSFLGSLDQIKAEKYKLQKYSRFFIPPTAYSKILSSTITSDLKTLIRISHSKSQLSIHLPLLGSHFSHNVSAVVSICSHIGIPTEIIKSGLESAPIAPHRMNLIRLPNGNLLLDDTYNANPLSVSEALHTLTQISIITSSTPVFFFAQMNELGDYETSAHEQIGRLVKKLKIKDFYCLGPATKHSMHTAGYGKYFTSLADLRQTFSKTLQRKSQVILLKGSRSWHLDQLLFA